MSAVLQTGQVMFRVLEESDLDDVMSIELAAYSHPWTRGIFRDCIRVGYSCWVLECDDRIVGYGLLSVAAGEAHILNICVHDDHRRRGYGAAILAHLMDLADRRKVDTVLLEVRPSNVVAIQLYEGYGFNEVGVRRNYYPADKGREDAIILAKSLYVGGKLKF